MNVAIDASTQNWKNIGSDDQSQLILDWRSDIGIHDDSFTKFKGNSIDGSRTD